MPIVFYNGQILFTNGLISMDPSCCCGSGSCCCVIDPRQTYHVTISAPNCTNNLNGMVIPLSPIVALGGCYGFTGSKMATACHSAVFLVVVNIRCNESLSDRGGGACDKYEIQMGYGASACLNHPTTWYRAETGCTCDPLNVVFKVPAPVWNGLGAPDCDCCVPPDDLTVTLTL